MTPSVCQYASSELRAQKPYSEAGNGTCICSCTIVEPATLVHNKISRTEIGQLAVHANLTSGSRTREKNAPPAQPEYDEFLGPGRILNVSLSKAAVTGELLQPNQEIYQNKTWRPTAVVTIPSGKSNECGETVRVADGYGQSLLHQFATNGTRLRTVDGTGSGLAFDTPHALTVNPRPTRAELLVADRANRRIVVLSAEGDYLRSFGQDSLTSPSGMVVMDDGTIIITELFGSIAAFTAEGEHIGSLGSPVSEENQRSGWPNEITEAGNTTRPPLNPGHFNSPHGICMGDGAILVTEWVIGGRIVRLTPLREEVLPGHG